MRKEVLIVGAGIIGLYLAKELQKKGYKVVVFEKNKEIGKKPCSSLITERIFEFIPEASDLATGKIKEAIVHLPKKDFVLEFNPCLYLFEREKLDNLLFSLAKKEGVEIYLGKELTNFPQNFFKIIGCDGALSKVRELLKIKRPFLRLGIQYFVEKGKNQEIEIWPRREIMGFIWRIPRENFDEYGAIGKPEKTFLVFEEFLKERGIKIEKGKIKSALIPLGLALPKNQKITLCGDSAGLATPISGGGIIWGLKSAKILLEEFPDFLSYERKVKKFFKWKIEIPKIIFKFVLSIFDSPFSFFSPKRVEIDTNLFYSFLSYKIYFFGGVCPTW